MILEAYVTIMVSNVNKAIAFYDETMGLKLRKKYNSKYAEFQVNRLVIGLHLKDRETSDVCKTNSVLVGFRVEELNSSVSELKNRGVKFSTEIEEGAGGRFAYFTDPDGNPLYLWQSLTH